MADKEKPIYSVKIGTINGAVWLKTGEHGKWYSPSIKNQYYDEKAKEWKDSTNFAVNQLSDLSLVANDLYAWCRKNPPRD